jgi:universal stress protein E
MPGFKFTRILVTIADPSAGMSNAVRRAGALAHATGASIELLNAIPSAMSEGAAHAQAERFVRFAAEQNRRALERTANRLRREEIIVETTVQTGYPAHEAILRRARLGAADLVIIEAHKHRVFARLLLTQTDFELIRHCPVPLLIVKGRAAWRSPRILAAIDPFHANDKPSRLDGNILDAALAVADLVRGSVHAAHVYRPYVGPVVAAPVGAAVFAADPVEERAYEASVRKRFYEALGRYGIPRSRAHLVCGEPAIEIPAAARRIHAGIIVMGAVSRSGLKRIFVGNTAEQVLDGVHCDVLVVKP